MTMNVLITIFYIVACVMLFALAIIIHEFGHFLVAVKLGLRVTAFSIGFGPVIWKKTYRGVEYRISWLPLGGYVMIPDLDPEGTAVLEGGAEAKPRQRIPAWKEIAVSVAGPGMNLVLATVLAVGLALVPSARFGEVPAVIGTVMTGGPAEKAGLKGGDEVLAVAGNPVRSWSEMLTEVQIVGTNAAPFLVLRDGVERTLVIAPKRDEVSGVSLIYALSTTNNVGAAAWMPARSPWRQLAWDAGSIFRILKGLVTPRESKSTAKAIGGPVMIAENIYHSLRRNAWDGVGFMRFLNVNLAIVNLLPIPVLDGGIVFFALIALVFRRRVPDRIVNLLTMVFMVLLLGLMALLIGKDSWRSWKIHTYKPETVTTNAVDEADQGR